MIGPYRILIVDDEDNVRRSLERVFKGDPDYEVMTSASPHLAFIQLRNRLCDLVLTDLRMPQMTGLELLERVRDEFPYCVRILFSGNLDLKTAEEAINSGLVYRFVSKPWDNDELKTTIRLALEHRDALLENQRILEQVHEFARQLQVLEGEFPGMTSRFMELGRTTRVVRHARAVETIERVLAHNERELSGKTGS